MDPEISNIVIACPNATWSETDGRWEGVARDLAMFYAELLGMKIVREDWLKIGWEGGRRPHLAFGDGPTENYLPPRWGEPERPAQVYLEIPVSDLDAAGSLALRLGAKSLDDQGTYRSYADPVGHPFRLYFDPTDAGTPDRPLSGRIGRVVFECFSPRALARFWSELVGMPELVEDSPRRVVISRIDASLPMLGFQHAVVPPPRWPDPQYPQQLHLDIYFNDGKAGQELAETLGAIRLPAMGGSCPVYADPAAHPFCLCQPGQ